MTEAVLIDVFNLKLNSEDGSFRKSLLNVLDFADRNYGTSTQLVYVMCCQSLLCERNGIHKDILTKSLDNCKALKRGFQVVWNSSMAAMLYSIKQQLDEKDVSIVRIILPKSKKSSMQVFVDHLFTTAYQLEYKVFDPICDEDDIHEATALQSGYPSELQLQHIKSDIATFLGSLPGLKGDLAILKSPLISDSHFIHGFSTRAGGISYIKTLSSLNLFSSSSRKDPKSVVGENLRRLAKLAGFNPDSYRSVKVDHGNQVWIVGKPEPDSYDGIVTNRKGVTIAAPGADCIPILFSDPVKKVCGAAHSGWKGTLLGVAMATVNAMVTEFGCRMDDIVVVMGPSVGPCCFTLPLEAAKEFQALDPRCVRQFDLPRPYIDIRKATRVLLERGGIQPQNIQDDSVIDQSRNLTFCTACHPEMFFSHVRDGINFGTQIGFISIKD
ncbi:purine nucleoside phosphorylase LACC1 [Ambystoma mexicanum]|uniref:purine nucleoside phosphorylase LACC1 n=1 Tax=Ambystoma mexicanum TaxID=8296 RepID=UPI0037E8F678